MNFFEPKHLERETVEYVKPGKHGDLNREQVAFHHGNGSFSIISAENPPEEKHLPKHLKEQKNLQRTKELEQHLMQSGAHYSRLMGKYGVEERSFLIHHTKSFTPDHAEKLANKYKQESLIHVSRGKNQMLYLRGEHAGKARFGDGITFKPGTKEDFSMPIGRFEAQHTSHFDWNDKNLSSPLRKSLGENLKTEKFYHLGDTAFKLHFS